MYVVAATKSNTEQEMYRNKLRGEGSLRSSDATGGIGRDGGKGELADGGGRSVARGESGGADAAASGADGEEIKVVVAVRVCSVVVLRTDGKAARGGGGVVAVV